MNCKKCGTQFSTNWPDSKGYVACPHCNTLYKVAEAQGGAAGPAVQNEGRVFHDDDAEMVQKPSKPEKPPKKAKPSTKNREGSEPIEVKSTASTAPAPQKRVSGKVIILCTILVAAAVALLAVLLLTVSQPADTPQGLVKLYEKALNGDENAAWNMLSPYTRKTEYDNDKDKFKTEYEKDIKAYKNNYGDDVKFSLAYISYTINGTYSNDQFDDGRTESGYIEFAITTSYNGRSDTSTTYRSAVKIEGKWYLY